MATIDNLSIQINASVERASKAIDKLVSSVSLLADAMNKFQTVKAENFTTVKNGIEKLGQTNTENLSKVGRALKSLGKGMHSFNAVSFSQDKSNSINNMTSSLDKMSSIPEIPIAKIKLLPQVAKNISKFSQEISKAAQLTFDSTKITGIISPLSNLNTDKLVPMTAKLPTIANNLSKFYSKISQTGTINFNITKLVNLITKFETVSGNISSIEKSASKLPSIGYNLSGFYSQIKKSGTITFDIAGLSKLITGLEKVSGKTSSVETLAAKLPTIGSNLSKFIREINKAGKVTFDITSLANLISGINRLGSKTATTATTNLPKISKDLQDFIKGLNGLKTINFDVAGLANLVNSISKLGSKSVSSAVTNIPLITTALKDMMTQLSSAPRVSRNIIDMANALANLIRQSRSASSASGRFSSSMNRTSSSISKSHQQFKTLTLNLKSLTQQLLAASGIYLSIYGTVRGFKNAIQSSMDYVEDLNYFNAAFGQVAESADLSSFREAGYNSATAYFDSFAKRAEQITQKMTGYQVSQSGMLLSTGQKNLGIDPSQLMNYQAVFGQMSSSMGVTSENALLLSDVLTKIGADLASVKNMDFGKVWEDMASGLAGMSRTLDKYGVNIRNVNLQQKLNELGIQANITKLNQNEKALLRTIILLDTTRYAWADMADRRKFSKLPLVA